MFSLTLLNKRDGIKKIRASIEENLRGFYSKPEYSDEWCKKALEINKRFNKVLINTKSVISSDFKSYESTIDLSNIHILDEEIISLANQKEILIPINMVNEVKVGTAKKESSEFTLEFLGYDARELQLKEKINNDLKYIIKNAFEGCNSVKIIVDTNKFFSEYFLNNNKLKQEAITIVELMNTQKYIVFCKSYFCVCVNNEHSEFRPYDTRRQAEFEDRENIINFRKSSMMNEVMNILPKSSDNINKLEANPDIIKRIKWLANEITQYKDRKKFM